MDCLQNHTVPSVGVWSKSEDRGKTVWNAWVSIWPWKLRLLGWATFRTAFVGPPGLCRPVQGSYKFGGLATTTSVLSRPPSPPTFASTSSQGCDGTKLTRLSCFQNKRGPRGHWWLLICFRSNLLNEMLPAPLWYIYQFRYLLCENDNSTNYFKSGLPWHYQHSQDRLLDFSICRP